MTTSLLANYPVIVQIPVQWGELDLYGHVNNTVFFRYFETARIAYLEQSGFIESYDRDRIGAILHSTDCRFRIPLEYPDTVRVGARAIDIADDRFTMGYRVVSQAHEAIAAEGSGIIVSFDYNRRTKAPIPDLIRQRIGEIEATTL